MNLDEGIVGWDGQDDPAMPLNLPRNRKWLLVGLLSCMTLVTPFASSILSPGISNLYETSLLCLGLGLPTGPLLKHFQLHHLKRYVWNEADERFQNGGVW